MNETRKTLTLTKSWGRYKAKQKLGVLLPYEDPEPGLVDPQRAAQLVADKFGRWDEAAEVEE